MTRGEEGGERLQLLCHFQTGQAIALLLDIGVLPSPLIGEWGVGRGQLFAAIAGHEVQLCNVHELGKH